MTHNSKDLMTHKENISNILESLFNEDLKILTKVYKRNPASSSSKVKAFFNKQLKCFIFKTTPIYSDATSQLMEKIVSDFNCVSTSELDVYLSLFGEHAHENIDVFFSDESITPFYFRLFTAEVKNFVFAKKGIEDAISNNSEWHDSSSLSDSCIIYLKKKYKDYKNIHFTDNSIYKQARQNYWNAAIIYRIKNGKNVLEKIKTPEKEIKNAVKRSNSWRQYYDGWSAIDAVTSGEVRVREFITTNYGVLDNLSNKLNVQQYEDALKTLSQKQTNKEGQEQDNELNQEETFNKLKELHDHECKDYYIFASDENSKGNQELEEAIDSFMKSTKFTDNLRPNKTSITNVLKLIMILAGGKQPNEIEKIFLGDSGIFFQGSIQQFYTIATGESNPNITQLEKFIGALVFFSTYLFLFKNNYKKGKKIIKHDVYRPFIYFYDEGFSPSELIEKRGKYKIAFRVNQVFYKPDYRLPYGPNNQELPDNQEPYSNERFIYKDILFIDKSPEWFRFIMLIMHTDHIKQDALLERLFEYPERLDIAIRKALIAAEDEKKKNNEELTDKERHDLVKTVSAKVKKDISSHRRRDIETVNRFFLQAQSAGVISISDLTFKKDVYKWKTKKIEGDEDNTGTLF